MNSNTVWAALIVGGAAVAGATALALGSGYNPLQKYATVVSVAPAFETAQTPRIACGEQELAALAAQPAGGASATPPVAAATSGPPDEAAAAENGDASIPECRTVLETRQVDAGFDVTYELDGVQRVVRMDRNPGPRIPVENGELVLSRL